MATKDVTSFESINKYLDNLSVDQLKDIVANPRPNVPTVLALSKLQEKMQMKAAPTQLPTSTVAKELMARAQQGIGSLPQEPEVMARGGIVKMQMGGEAQGQGSPDIRSMSDADLQSYLNYWNIPERSSLLSYLGVENRAAASPFGREQIISEMQRRQPYTSALPSDQAREAIRGNLSSIPPSPSDIIRNTDLENVPSSYMPQTAAPSSSAPAPTDGSVGGGRLNSAIVEPDLGGGPRINSAIVEPSISSAGAPGGGRAGIGSLAGAGGAGAGGGGGGGMGGAGAPGPSGAPTNPLQEALANMRSSQEDLRKLYERAGQGPTTQERRQEAINMALLQAGLGMMQPGQSNALAAISRGALPALQTLGENFRYIRKEDKDSIMDQLRIKNQEALGAFHQGTIGYHIYDTQVKENIARANNEARLAGAAARQDYNNRLLELKYQTEDRLRQSGEANLQLKASNQLYKNLATAEGNYRRYSTDLAKLNAQPRIFTSDAERNNFEAAVRAAQTGMANSMVQATLYRQQAGLEPEWGTSPAGSSGAPQ